MKCGIITYHFANNYGAMLQCFALKRAVEKLGHTAIVINYISEKQYDNNSLYRKKQGIRGYVKNVLLLPFAGGRKRRDLSFRQFREQFLTADEKRLLCNDELHSYIIDNRFDVVISGSDQVWNPNVFDFEDSFFYPFELQAKKIGYAVSLGSATVEQLQPYKKWIEQFDKITVREQKSAKILFDLAQRASQEVSDPVLLHNKDFWLQYTEKIQDSYMACYFVREEDMGVKLAMAKRLAEKMHLKLKVIDLRITKYNLTNHIYFDRSPFDFLTLLSNAEYVYTDSFHGTVFSLIFEKNFTTVESDTETLDSRKRNILKKVGLTSRVQNVNESARILDPIDYSAVTPRITALRNESLELLSKLLEQTTVD